jgi:hypothetical protein
MDNYVSKPMKLELLVSVLREAHTIKRGSLYSKI